MRWLPLTRSQWKAEQQLYAGMPDLRPHLQDEGEILRRNADFLLELLYQPSAEVGGCVSRATLRRAKIEDEPVNWGDLSASVQRQGAVWVVTLEEATTGQCPTLCAYIQGWLQKWGWQDVVVQTEW